MATDNDKPVHGHFEFAVDAAGFHRIHVQAPNNEVVASGEGYVNSTVPVAIDLVFWVADALLGTPELLEKPLTEEQIERLVVAQASIEEFLLTAQGA